MESVGQLDALYMREILCYMRPPGGVVFILGLAACVMGLAPNTDRVMTWSQVRRSLGKMPAPECFLVRDYMVADLIPYFIEASLRLVGKYDSGLDFLIDPEIIGRRSVVCETVVRWLRRVWGFYKALVVSEIIGLKDSKVKEVLDNLELDVF